MSSFNDRLQTCIDFTEEAIASVRSGTLLDLAPLDGIDTLCREIEKAGSKAVQDADPLMAQLIARLDVLADEIAVYKDSLNNKG